MNMKKSIAGIMAGAMAVSAMATTASAWSGGGDQTEILLNYDLRKKGEAYADTKVTVVYKYFENAEGYQITATDNGLVTGDKLGEDGTTKVKVKVGAKLTKYQYYNLDSVTIDATGFSQFDPVTGATYNPHNVVDFVSEDAVGADMEKPSNILNNKISGDDLVKEKGKTYAFKIPFDITTSNLNAFNVSTYKMADVEAEEVEAKFTGATITYTICEMVKPDAGVEADTPKAVVSADIGNLPTKDVYDSKDEADAVAKAFNDTHVKYDKDAGKTDPKETYFEEAKVVEGTDTAAGTFTVVYTPWKAGEEKEPVLTPSEKTLKYDATMKAEFDTKWAELSEKNKQYKLRAAGTGYADQVGDITAVDFTYTVPADGSTEAPAAAATRYGFKNYTVTLNYTANKEKPEAGDAANVVNVSEGIVDIDRARFTVTHTPGAKAEYFMPLRSAPNKPANVIARLEENEYTWPLAVLNDVIANEEAVSFTFTTAQNYIDTREWVKAKKFVDVEGSDYIYVIVENPKGGQETIEYERDSAELRRSGSDLYVQSKADLSTKYKYYGVAYDADKDGIWYNPYFQQALYQKWTWAGNKNGYVQWGPNGEQKEKDMFGSYASAWNQNLLMAGLVVNSGWSMQLNQATGLEWGDKTITFFWDDITSDEKTNFTDVITTMQLVTPTEWFWDNLSVGVGAAAVENANTGEGLEEDAEEVAEEEVSEEEVIEEEPIEEDLGEDELFEEETEETEEELPEETEAPAEEESPKTGNAPVALAVIPVALAAAAVIAKKKN